MNLREDPEFLNAVELHKSGHFDEAGLCYERLQDRYPAHSDLWHFQGLLEVHRGNVAKAITLINLAITLKTDNPEYYQTLAMAHIQGGNTAKAAAIYCEYGNALQEQCRYAEAVEAYNTSLKLAPNYLPAFSNRAAAYDRAGDYKIARQEFYDVSMVLAAEAKTPEAFLNLGNAYSGLGQTDHAIEAYRQAIILNPDFALAHFYLAMSLLLQGRLEEGWREFEWRFVCSSYRNPRRGFRQPVWQGEPPEILQGPLLVTVEQGLGDTIQFVRYVWLLAERYEIIFEVAPELYRLFCEGMVHPRIKIIPRTSTPDNIYENLTFAAYVAIMSLPLHFNTTLQTIPNHTPYISVSEANRDAWKLPAETLKVGLVWRGNPRNSNDNARSLDFEKLAPLLNREGVTFYSLQKGITLPPNVVGLSERFTDFADTAAAIVNLDLVIAVDTSVAHLAGALNCPVWLLASKHPDWRWLESRNQSPWYPSMRLFRQAERGEWDPVITELETALDQLIEDFHA